MAKGSSPVSIRRSSNNVGERRKWLRTQSSYKWRKMKRNALYTSVKKFPIASIPIGVAKGLRGGKEGPIPSY